MGNFVHLVSGGDSSACGSLSSGLNRDSKFIHLQCFLFVFNTPGSEE